MRISDWSSDVCSSDLAEGADRRVQGAFEDKLLNKLRRLQQRVALARRLRQVLMQVAEKARVERRVAKIMQQGAGIRVDLLPEHQQGTRRFKRQWQREQRVDRKSTRLNSSH